MPDPKASVPDAEAVQAMAAEDAGDAVERVRCWSSEHPAMPLLREIGGQTSYQARVERKIAEKWPDPLWEEYRAAFKGALDKENVHYMEQWSRDPKRIQVHVVDLTVWESELPPPPEGGFNPNAGWRRRESG